MDKQLRNRGGASVSPCLRGEPCGYVISRDRYLKRDELGVIYQLCVDQRVQRSLIGAALVREVFERSAYGCRLYCCWCAQDLEANHFWESLGFVPIAFRAGSSGKKRVHIFWQKRIVEGDIETKWWYPSQTNQGAIREDRLVFPIPPGVHWKDVQGRAVPETTQRRLEHRDAEANGAAVPPAGPLPPTLRRVQFGPPGAAALVQEKQDRREDPPARARRPRKRAEKIDPKLVRAARELRDRYLEQVNSQPLLPAAHGKYAVSRALPDAGAQEPGSVAPALGPPLAA